jgi:hypothetical protein
MPIHDWTRVDDGTFHDFHNMWIVALRNSFKHVLPDGYYAMTNQKAFGYAPDVVTLGTDSSTGSNGSTNGSNLENGASGGLSVATAPPRVLLRAKSIAPQEEYKHRWIKIKHVSGDRVVAIVEIVSPGNKSSEDALRSFTSKAAEFLEYGVHVLVVDLFPPSVRDPQGIHRAIWGIRAADFTLPPGKPLTLVSYSAGKEQVAYIQPVAVGDSLPDMPLFLTPETYVQVALEKTYSLAFEDVTPRGQTILTAPPN